MPIRRNVRFGELTTSELCDLAQIINQTQQTIQRRDSEVTAFNLALVPTIARNSSDKHRGNRRKIRGCLCFFNDIPRRPRDLVNNDDIYGMLDSWSLPKEFRNLPPSKSIDKDSVDESSEISGSCTQAIKEKALHGAMMNHLHCLSENIHGDCDGHAIDIEEEGKWIEEGEEKSFLIDVPPDHERKNRTVDEMEAESSCYRDAWAMCATHDRKERDELQRKLHSQRGEGEGGGAEEPHPTSVLEEERDYGLKPRITTATIATAASIDYMKLKEGDGSHERTKLEHVNSVHLPPLIPPSAPISASFDFRFGRPVSSTLERTVAAAVIGENREGGRDKIQHGGETSQREHENHGFNVVKSIVDPFIDAQPPAKILPGQIFFLSPSRYMS